MKKLGTIILSGLFIFLALASPAAHAAPFDKLVGQDFALVLTGPDSDNMYLDQMDLLSADVANLKAHNVVVIHFYNKTLFTLDNLSTFNYSPYKLNKAAQVEYLAEQLQTDDDTFSAVLVGTNGIVQKVWTEPVQPQELYNVMEGPQIEAAPPAPKPAEKSTSEKLKEEFDKIEGKTQ